jgi:hypothetical protein
MAAVIDDGNCDYNYGPLPSFAFCKRYHLALRMFFVPLQQREKAVLTKDIFLNI